MEKVFIDIRNENEWIKKYFNNKDFASIDELLNVVEELDSEIERLKEEIEDIKKDVEDNYKPISHYDEYGISESDFH